MGIIGLITGLLKLAGIIAGIAEKQQLISAGVSKAVAVSVQATLENIDLARKAKDAMAAGDSDWAQRVRDKYDRK